MTLKNSRRIKLLFPKISEIVLKNISSWSGNGIVRMTIYNIKDRYETRRASYALFDISRDGLFMHSIYDDVRIGVDVERSAGRFSSPKLVMDIVDLL